MRKHIKNISSIFVLLLTLIAITDSAFALKVTTQRLIFNEKNKTSTLTLLNEKNVPQTYRISVMDMRMSPTKVLSPVKTEEDRVGLNSAQNYIRFAPRRVTIDPGGYQTIRLMARVPENIEPGEYRSHLAIHPEPVSGDRKREKNMENLGSSVEMLTAITFPIFVRHGKISAEVGIEGSAARIEKGHQIKLSLNRSGTKSIFGDVNMVCINTSGDDFLLRQARGLAVYTEINNRNLDYTIPNPEGFAGNCSHIFVQFVSADKDGTAGQILAEASIPVQ